MMNSIMKADRIKKLLYGILVAIFWITVWFILSIIVNNDFLLPSPISTVKELFSLMSEASFYKVVFYTLIRVILGVVIGVFV